MTETEIIMALSLAANALAWCACILLQVRCRKLEKKLRFYKDKSKRI